MRKELESRLIDFTLQIAKLTENLNKGFLATHLSKQILRSTTSAALNYGEAQSSESQKDFVHKISIVLKELRETKINIKIIQGAGLSSESQKIIEILNEGDELVAIFYKTWETASGKL